MEQTEIQHFIEAALLAAGRPLSVDQIHGLFDGRSAPEKSDIRKAIEALNDDYEDRGIEIREVASGFRMQVKASMSDRLQKLWEERPPRYSRALFETLALVAYRQPITRGEIEDIRGVSVSSNIIRTLMERDWIRVVGHRDVPGRPAMFGTTKGFLDYFNLKKLDDLPALADLADWESLRVQLDLPDVDSDTASEIEMEFVAEAGESDDSGTEIPEAEPAGKESTCNEQSEGEQPGMESVEEASDDDIPELVVEATNTDLPELVIADDDVTDAEDISDEAAEELVVSEWPDPASSSRN